MTLVSAIAHRNQQNRPIPVSTRLPGSGLEDSDVFANSDVAELEISEEAKCGDERSYDAITYIYTEFTSLRGRYSRGPTYAYKAR